MTTFTTEQNLPFTFRLVDGKGRPVPMDTSNPPVAASSDETVATVSLTHADDGSWHGLIASVSASPADSTQRVTLTVDADVGDGVESVIGTLDFNVTLDPRSSARIVEMVAETPVEK